MPVNAVDKPSRSTGGGAEARPALELLAVFASVAERFHLLLTDLAGSKVAFRGNRSLAELRATLPRILGDAARQQHNVILRPRGSATTLIQLDDLNSDAEAKLRSVSLLTLRTSPGN